MNDRTIKMMCALSKDYEMNGAVMKKFGLLQKTKAQISCVVTL